MSSLSGVELLGFWEFGVGGLIGGKRVGEKAKERATPCIHVTIICALRMIENNDVMPCT